MMPPVIDFEEIWDSVNDTDAPETRFVKAYLTLRGPCAACGKQYDIPSVKNARAACEQSYRTWTHSPSLAEAVCRLPYLCPTCLNKTDDEKRRYVLAQRVSTATSYALGKELIGFATLTMCEANHLKIIESVNPLSWKVALGFTKNTDNLWIHGATGVGKTFLARYILNMMLNRGWSVGEITGTQWVERSVAFDKHITFRKELSKQRLVLIDDIDKAPWTEQALDAYFDFLNYRYDAKLRLLITSNTRPEYMLSRGDAGQQIPVGIFRRIAGQNPSKAEAIMERMLPMERVHLVGDSLRKEATLEALNKEGVTE